jgi:TetR/AcrR family transcriptional regulator
MMQELNEAEHKIVEAATQVFLEKGKAGARTQTIADLAGINKSLLHYYFRTKEKLYNIVSERIIRRVFDGVLGKISEETEFEIWLPAFVHSYLETISKNPMVSRFMLWEIEAGGGRIAEIVKAVLGTDSVEHNPIFRIVDKAVKEGKIRPLDPVQFIISLLAMCIYPYVARPILEKIIPGLEISSESFRAEREQAILDLVWNGVRPTPDDTADCAELETLSNGWLLW